MVKKVTSILPLPSLVFITLCFLGICGALVLIFLNQNTNDVLELQIREKQTKREERKLLIPLYEQLKQALVLSEQLESMDLPFRKGAPLDHLDIQQIQSDFSTIIHESGLIPEKIEPDLTSIIDNSHHLGIDAVMTGDFMDFRTAVLNLYEKIPSIVYIQHMQIERIENTKRLRFLLEMQLAKK
jgi:hypothetical protein